MQRPLAILCLSALACASSPPVPTAAPRAAPPAPIEATAAPAGVLREAPLPDGRALTLRADGSLTRGRGEAIDARATVTDPGACALRPWGSRGVALCPGGDADPGRPFAGDSPFLAQLRGPLSTVIPGRDGRTLTRNGSCDPSVELDATRESAACTWSEGRGWRGWTVDRSGARVLDVYDQHALVRWAERVELPERPPITHEVVGLYDIDQARWVPLSPPDPTARWVCAGFDPDGRVRAIVHTGTLAAPRAWRLLGGDDRDALYRLQARPLPFAAEDLGGLDDLRMVLVRGAEVVAMRDAERVIPVRSPEPLAASARQGATRCGDRVVCGGDRCVVDGRISVPVAPARDPLAP